MPNIYYPILRNRGNEREVIRAFGGLANLDRNVNFPLDLKPIVEIEDDDDLDSLQPFQDAGNEVLVDLPAYQAERESDFGNAIEETIQDYGDRQAFFLDNVEEIGTPVVSGLIADPVDYGVHSRFQTALKGTFPSIAHRLMVRSSGPLSAGQREQIQNLDDELQPTDKVFLDVVDFNYNAALEADLQFLSESLDCEQALLNIFNVFNDQLDNRTPNVADGLGMTGFGDFAINVRYPGGGGQGDTVTIRHYHPYQSFVEEF